MQLPVTSAIVGRPAAEAWVRLRKLAPPGTKISFCRGRSAPPDSTKPIAGRRLALATSWARRFFRSVYGLLVPPRTVGSDAPTRHSTPSITPIPLTWDAPTSYSEP